MSDQATATSPTVNPAPPPSAAQPLTLDDIEATLDKILAADPAELTRLQVFFNKLRQVKPRLDQILAMVDSLR